MSHAEFPPFSPLPPDKVGTVTDEINRLAGRIGYEGNPAKTATDAINNLASYLGYEGSPAKNVASAIHNIPPIGDGGGGGEVTSYTLENFNTIEIEFPQVTTLHEDEIDAWVDGRIESWINGQIEYGSVEFDYHSNMITEKFGFLLDKNRNIVDIEIEPEAPAVGGGIVLASRESVFLVITFEKEDIPTPETLPIFHLSPQQSGYYHKLYAIRTEYDDNDLLVPLEVVGKFDAEELIEDTADIIVPGQGTFSFPLVNYPSLNSSLSLDDFIAAGFSPDQIVEPRIVLCEIYIRFTDGIITPTV